MLSANEHILDDHRGTLRCKGSGCKAAAACSGATCARLSKQPSKPTRKGYSSRTTHCHDPESCRSIDELDPWSLRIIMLSLLVSEEWFQWNLDNAFISLL